MTSIHLCQPDKNKSCGACCGIYNYVANTKFELIRRFDYREKLMQKVRNRELSLEAYRDIIRRREGWKADLQKQYIHANLPAG